MRKKVVIIILSFAFVILYLFSLAGYAIKKTNTQGMDNNSEYIIGNTDNDTSINGQLLKQAMKESNYMLVRSLLENGADANYVDKSNISLLMYSVGGKSGNLTYDNYINVYYTKLLIQYGADVNYKGRGDYTALDFAVKEGYLEAVKFLLEKGASVNENTLKIAMNGYDGKGYCNYEIINLILKENNKEGFDSQLSLLLEASILGKSGEVLTLLDGDIENENTTLLLFYISSYCNSETLGKLISLGVDINILDETDNDLLNVTSRIGNLDNVKYLLNAGADIESTSPFSQTPLFLAVTNNHYEVAEYLLSKGAIAEYTPVYEPESSLIGVAAYNNNLNLIELLYSYGYQKNGQTSFMAMEAAIKANNIDILNYFLNNGADVNIIKDTGYTDLLSYCCLYDNVDAAKLLILNQANINGSSSRSNPLETAIERNNFEMVQLLIENGANVNIYQNDPQNYESILMKSVKLGYFNIVKILVENGSDLECKSWKNKDTVIMIASKSKNDILNYLIESGANINFQNINGDTPLMYAVKAQNENNVELLINSGANESLQNNENLTALDIAKKLGDKEIKKILEKNN